jgi:hypothetical protein
MHANRLTKALQQQRVRAHVGQSDAYAFFNPPYTSKWHRIEHRLFSQIERSLSSVIPDSPQTALVAVDRTRTQTGPPSRPPFSITSTRSAANAPPPSMTSNTTSFATMPPSVNGIVLSTPMDFQECTYYLFLTCYLVLALPTLSLRNRSNGRSTRECKNMPARTAAVVIMIKSKAEKI